MSLVTRSAAALALSLTFGTAVPVHAADAPADSARTAARLTPVIHAARVTGGIRIDGVLDEPAWSSATPATDFTQLDPQEGQPVSERTEVRVLLDGDAIVIGARLWDREASRVKARLARRDDDVESDQFEVSLDTFHDHLTARVFRINPAGVVRDALIGADGNTDDSWDAVWEGAAHVDDAGWSAELRIPLSQLRYSDQPDAVWGIQLMRFIHRKAESAYFAFTPKKERGGVARYGHLEGLGRLPQPRHLELMPYVAGRNERFDVDPTDPFRSPSDYLGNAGGDLKYGVTSDLTLDLTVNPDFGQVEVDPAEVNLTAFETFYPEKRPFFVEGADLFSFGRSRAFNNFSVPTIFFSRRIGRSPQLGLGGTGYVHIDAPDQTTIAGAAKLTGRTHGGWAIGLLDAVTVEEQAVWEDTAGLHRETPVEPLTHYFAGRLRRDLRNGNTSIGALFTATNRRLDTPGLEGLLRSDSYLGGIDFAHAWAKRRWAIDADVTGAMVNGSTTAIGITQRASSRYLQRPDHDDYFVYDPTRTHLSGYGFDGSISKQSGNHWRGSLAYVDRSPGYEANDLGFQTRADYRGFSSIVLYSENQPGPLFRNWTVYPYANQMWNYGRDLVYNSYALTLDSQLANYWPLNVSITTNRDVFDDRLTRGGPQARTVESSNFNVSLDSDPRRSWTVGASYTHAWNAAGGWGEIPSLNASFRFSPTLRLRFSPSYSRTRSIGQYLFAVPDPDAADTYGQRYVFASLAQHTISLETRLDWTLTPRLSLQLWMQPLVVTGDYMSFKEFRQPGAFEFDIYGKDAGTISGEGTGLYTVDPGNGSVFQFPDPDFNFRSLLGNAVLRWEYRPGSTMYFVWQQRRSDVAPLGDFEFERDYSALLHRAPENVFAVKATWWIGL
jgi:hypothetical protein